MIRAFYHELDGPNGITRRLTVKGHAGYAPAGQDIVCAGASILMQALVWMTAGSEEVDCAASDGPEGPRISVTASPSRKREDSERLAGGFELAKAGLTLLAERYPDHLRFADTSRRGEAGMVDLQLFARREKRAGPPRKRPCPEPGTGAPGCRRRDPAPPARPGGGRGPGQAPRETGKARRRVPRWNPCWGSGKRGDSSAACTGAGPWKKPRCAGATRSSRSGRR